jgi:hypothetical protein
VKRSVAQVIRAEQQGFDDHLARILEGMADRLEGKAPKGNGDVQGSFERLEQKVRTCCPEQGRSARGSAADVSYPVPQNRKLNDLPGRGTLTTKIAHPAGVGITSVTPSIAIHSVV